MIKYRLQLLITLTASVLLVYVLTLFSEVSKEIEYFEVFTEGVIAICCLFLMFWIEHLNLQESRRIYWSLLISSSFLFIGHLLDALDELTIELSFLDFWEDIFMPVGFLLFLWANFLWITFYKQQVYLLDKLAKSDPLTGVLNRRAFTEKGNSIFDSSHSNDRQVSVIIIDIDYFKKINDTYGHQHGDQVLVELAANIKARLRKSDYLARIGGEEFAVLLYDTNVEEAALVAEKIRVSVENMQVVFNQRKVTCTVSLGVANTNITERGLKELIGKADKALYDAKANGRNCWQEAI